MDFEEKRETLAAVDENIVLLDGYEDALIGYTAGHGPPRAVYNYFKCLSILMKRDGMSSEEALEWFEYNTIRSLPYAGEQRPEILIRFKDC
jgi:hypothetical protein